jgi:predicted RNA-binding protein with PIN domain
MRLLIDGYNLLFAAGFGPRAGGSKALEQARHRLLQFLVAHLPPETRCETLLVFDANVVPHGAQPAQTHAGLRVLFAHARGEEADDLIERLLRQAPAPKRLTVVSSDLRLRVAAQRRGARSVKSEDWIDEIEQIQRTRSPTADEKQEPSVEGDKGDDVTAPEAAAWLNEFQLETRTEPPSTPAEPSAGEDSGAWGPFPRGYGDDLGSPGPRGGESH